ncbi:hypothetical protein LOAG_13766 [Loa loa]|uniref:Uncharacterized protein n=1 Tax=Loa loa TaxID=7209 RepID=A0A1S0TIY6_LOALO|nr:hypothetical protein LOAG_13766 [Loa loa]EFO14751.2 hypothetical protein LOAG_13766 [Loa loa]
MNGAGVVRRSGQERRGKSISITKIEDADVPLALVIWRRGLLACFPELYPVGGPWCQEVFV